MFEESPDLHGVSEAEYTFDVVVSLPEWIERDVIEARARESLGINLEALQQLMASLRSRRVVKVKTDITRAQADSLAQKFESVGFRAEVTHSLKLKTMVQEEPDGLTECPACETRVKPGHETQCPNCGVYIKKLTPEFLERKRIMKKERERLAAVAREQRRSEAETERAEMERQIREEVRRQFEREHGSLDKNRNYKRLGVAAGLMLCIGAAFFVGRKFSPGNGLPGHLQSSTVLAKAADKEDDVQKTIRQANQLQLDMSRLSLTNSNLAGDKPGVDGKDSLLSNNTEGMNALEGTASKLNPESKREIGNQLVLLLAEIGQIERAHELIDQAISAEQGGSDIKLMTKLRVVQLMVEAWAIVHTPSEGAREQVQTLTTLVAEIPDENQKAMAASQIAAIVMRRFDMNMQTVEGLFDIADSAYKNQKNPEVGQVMLAMRGKAILNSAEARAERGMRQYVSLLAGQLGTITRLAPDSSASQLYAYNQQLSHMMGSRDGAQQSLQLALSKAHLAATPQIEAQQLRVICDAPGNYQEPTVQAALAAVLDAAAKKGGATHAAVLLELAQIHARNGNQSNLQETQKAMAALVQAKPDLLPYAQLMNGLTEIALAWQAQKSGDFAAIEAHLRQVSALLYSA